MKDIPGYEGLYAITEDGRVWSHFTNRWLKPRKQKNHYLRVGLCKDKKCKDHLIHRLVYETFISPIPNNMCINHKNQNPTDNRLSNLECITQKENNNWGSHNEKLSKSKSYQIDLMELSYPYREYSFIGIKKASSYFGYEKNSLKAFLRNAKLKHSNIVKLKQKRYFFNVKKALVQN